MKNKRLYSLLIATVVLVLAACGGGSGVKLGAFPAITKTEGDAAFTLTAPSSASPAAFTFSSSDPAVASISGSTVTVLLAGTTTITAGQPQMGSYNPTSTGAVLTVLARVCAAPTVRDNGQCVQPCTAPAVRKNGACVAPTVAGANVVTNGSLTWMPVTFSANWTDANAFCTTSTINGLTGWRLPTEFDLSTLFASGSMSGQGWSLQRTWTSTSGSGVVASHVVVNLGSASGDKNDQANDNSANVACVR
jgi:Tfp pilus assembly major pilin PilA